MDSSTTRVTSYKFGKNASARALCRPRCGKCISKLGNFSSLKHEARRGLQIFPHRRETCRRLYTYRFWKMKLRENSAKIFKKYPFFKKNHNFPWVKWCDLALLGTRRLHNAFAAENGTVELYFFSFPRVRIHVWEHFSLPWGRLNFPLYIYRFANKSGH